MNAQSVTLKQVSVTYHGSTSPALNRFTGSLVPGEVTALTGGDGAGKTTLLKLLAGQVQPSDGSVEGLPGKERLGYQPADSGVWRDMSVIENMRFSASIYHMSEVLARPRIQQLLNAANLDYVRDRTGRNLSGGMRQKLGVIMAALHRPDLLLLDEPTTGVDPTSREEIWTLISAEAAAGSAVVFATTYLDEAERSSKLYLMNRGKALASGTAAQVREQAPGQLWQAGSAQGKELSKYSLFGTSLEERPAQAAFHNWRRANTAYIWTNPQDHRQPADFTKASFDLENASIAFLLEDDERTSPSQQSVQQRSQPEPNGTKFAAKLPNREHSATESPKVAQISRQNARIANIRPLPGSPATNQSIDAPAGTPLLEASRVVKRFGNFTALHGVSLDVKPGEIVGLIGGNGAGKTTLIRILLGLEQPTEGSGGLFGKAPSLDSRRHIGYVPQGMGLYPTMSAQENMDFAASIYQAQPRGWVADYAKQLGKLPVGQQPLGAQRLLAYAIADEHEPELLILDEPTSGMDPVSRMRLWRELHRKADQGLGVLVTTHYMAEASQCDRCVIMARGRVKAEGTVDQIISGHTSLSLETANWEEAFNQLKSAGLTVSLDGTTLRLPDADPSQVQRVLQTGGIEAQISTGKATLEEILTLVSGDDSGQ
ncbi:hypothetical protein KIM372_00250 [Bombiscardovia nodaiensis]|uniref:ABC transporter domain-containing protein n=1 Tax=Bombiscardovia nodaiensis TaxID=2932181 RepID=A0ABN6S9Q1_9BIFI|nr:hypothetical protein KIM372_00250 [Bombiscardovia nodaiensis]